MNLREILSRALNPFRRQKLERQTEAEMRFHLEMETEAGIRRGLPRSEAERAARIRAGSVGASMEEVRDQRGLGWFDGISVDIRQAWIALRRRPGFLLVAVGALASAVAVNTLVFTMVYGVLLQPLPYRDPASLVRVFESSAPQPKFPLSIYNYQEDRRSNRSFESIGLYTRADMQLMHEERPERVTAVAISDDFFPTLGAPLTLGRNFTAAEMLTSARVVILSYSFWSSRYHADASVVGQTIRLDRDNWTVIGIAQEGFQHIGGEFRSPLQGDTVAVWRPLPMDGNPGCLRGCHYTNAIARLKPGVTLAAATEDLNRIFEDLAVRFPGNYKDRTARLIPLSQEVVGRSRSTVLLIMAAGALVLLLAGINVAGLSVARTLARRRELAVRQALGGGAWRIIRAVLSENLVLGILSGAIGLLATAALLPVLRALLPSDFPRLHEVVFRWSGAAFALVAALGTSTLAGLVAAFRQTTADPGDAVNEDARTASTSAKALRLRAALVAAQMALACVLCFAAILLLRSSDALSKRDHGFDPKGALTFQLTFPSKAYNDARMATFYGEAARRLQEIPGVRSAGFSTSVPWTGYDENTSFDIAGYTPRPGEEVSARYQAADSGFFPAIGMRLAEGRELAPADRADSPKVIVVNQALAKHFFPHGDAVGHRVNIWGDDRQIVGVMGDIRDYPADASAKPAFWMTISQTPFNQVRAVVRTEGDPLAMAPAIRAALQSIDSEMPMAEVAAMEDLAAAALAERRFALLLCEAFAVLAIVLAAIGIYAMLSYTVGQRRREIGIRLALGASRPAVLRSVLAGGLLLAAVGTGAGLIFEPAAGRALKNLLYGVSPTELLPLLAAPAIIILVALAGCLAPGWMAIRTEPMSALREQ
jgi:macrolide transport system ATP-binding/permease protein